MSQFLHGSLEQETHHLLELLSDATEHKLGPSRHGLGMDECSPREHQAQSINRCIAQVEFSWWFGLVAMSFLSKQ